MSGFASKEPGQSLDKSGYSLVKDPVFWVLVVAGCLWAGFLYWQFLPQSRHLWHSFLHDRNAHYYNAQSIAMDLRHGDLAHLVRDLDRLRVWGPLHPVICGVFLALFGVNFQVAILLSLLCWVATAALAYALVQRLMKGPAQGGALLAGILVLASPAYRAFSLDIMLESPGAFLTALLAFTYLVARQEPNPRHDRNLALALSALFFLKSNYWILGVVGLGLVEALRHGRVITRFLMRLPKRILRSGLRYWFGQPLLWAFAIPLVLMIGLKAAGPVQIDFGSKKWTLEGPEIPATLMAWSVLLSFLPWWWRGGSRLVAARVPRVGPLVWYHALPLMVWFVLPQRAGLFVSYLTRDHGVGESGDGLANRLSAYASTLSLDYHGNLTVLVMALILALLAFAAFRSFRPGAGLVLATFFAAVVLTALQPCCRSRFLHTWQVLFWVLAGCGAAVAGSLLARVGASRLSWLPGVGLVAAILLVSPRDNLLGRAPESGLKTELPSALDLAETYLDQVPQEGKVAILSNLPMKFYALWTCQQAQGITGRVEAQVHQWPTQPSEWETWLARRGWTSLVWIDVIDSRGIDHLPDPKETRDQAAVLPVLLQKQTILHPIHTQVIPELGCKVTVWGRDL